MVDKHNKRGFFLDSPFLDLSSGLAIAGFLTVGAMVQSAEAACISNVCTLTDRNSSAVIQVGSGGSGFVDYVVDGTDQLTLQQFFYRIGTTGREFPVNNLSLISATTFDNNSNGDDDQLIVVYESAGNFRLTIDRNLTGGSVGSGFSEMSSSILIRNLRPSTSLTLSFFDYNNYDLGTIANDDTLEFDSLERSFIQSDANTNLDVNAVATTFNARAFTAANVPTTLDSLNNTTTTNLTNAFGPVGPGDISGTYQWNFVIPGGGTRTISKTTQITSIPEPSLTFALLAIIPFSLKLRRF